MPTTEQKHDWPVRDLGDRPQGGDLLVSKERAQRYVLSVVPGEPQIRHTKSEGLLALARRFAEQRHVDYWFTADGSCTRLGGHRPPRGAGYQVMTPVGGRPAGSKSLVQRADLPSASTERIRSSDRIPRASPIRALTSGQTTSSRTARAPLPSLGQASV